MSPGAKSFRMGYTVRSADGYRLTEYVPYLRLAHRGVWANATGTDELELYDYNTDPDERVNQAANEKYANVVAKLKQVLREQYTVGPVYK